MRYTTVIDVTEIAEVYRNKNATWLYLWMAIKAGYHDNDRDQVKKSIRNLAADSGLTVSAVRHALKLLASMGLVHVTPEGFQVLKYLMPEEPTPRARTAKKEREAAAAESRNRANQEREEAAAAARSRHEQLRAMGKDEWMVYYEQRYAEGKAGDAASMEWCKKNWSTYEKHRDQIKKMNKSENV